MRSTRVVVAALLLSAGSSSADPVSQGVSWLLSKQDPTGTFGAATGEEPIVATHETLMTLRRLQLGAQAPAQSAELALAIAPRPIDSELVLRRYLALAPTAWVLGLEQLATHGPGFDADDAHHLAW
jgi:hypothetical protein